MREFEQKKIANHSPSTFFGPKVQKKLTTGAVGDKYEVEADNVADKVVNKRKTGGLLQTRSEEAVQQKPLAETISTVQKMDLAQEQPVQKKGEKEEDKKVQKKSDKEEDKKVQKKGEKEEDKKVQKKSDKEEDKKVQKKGEKEEEKKVQKKSDKEEDKKVQKKCAECENEDKKAQKKEEKTVQAKRNESNSVDENVESNLNSSKGRGNAMDKNTKREMESGFGADFSNVNIHTDSRAVQMSEELGAQAFTHGNDVYFNKGKYNPESKEGKHLLAHELTHTIQQTGSKQKSATIQKSSMENHSEDLHAERPENPQFKGNPPLEKANDNQMLISTGQKGQYVSELQQGLMKAGQSLPKFGADGDFGSETRNAVIGFQEENGLNKIDGIVGPETIGALDNKLVGQGGGKKKKPCKEKKSNTAPYSETFRGVTKVPFITTDSCFKVKISVNGTCLTKDCTAFDLTIDNDPLTKKTVTMGPNHTKTDNFSFEMKKSGTHNIVFSMPLECRGAFTIPGSVFKVSGIIKVTG